MLTFRKFILAVATLTGTIIGVGFFSLPYITLQVGIWIMLGYFLALGFLSILIQSLFGQVALKTADLKRFPGYVRTHLGRTAERVAQITTIFGLFGALLAYLIVGSEFLSELLSPIFGGGTVFYAILYFMAGALLILFGIKAISKIEFWGLVLFFVILAVMFLKGSSQINIANVFPGINGLPLNFRNFFLPYGPILFSLAGVSLIPEVEEMLGDKKKLLKLVIPVSILTAIIVYGFFIYFVLGIAGPQTTESALGGLKNFLNRGVFSLAVFFGVVATFTSFIALGLNLKNVFQYDLKINKGLAWLITCFTPLFLYFIGIKSFISVISFVGGIFLGIDGILILLMYKKVSQRKFLPYSLAVIFILGIIYEIIYFI